MGVPVVTVEPHPDPERALWRIAPPVTAAVLAAFGFVVMLAEAPEPVQTVALVVVLLAQVVLMATRGLVLRSSARMADRPIYWHQFFFAWSFFTSVIYLLGGDRSTDAAAEHVGAGLPFAVLFVLVLGTSSHRPRTRSTRRDGG